MMVDYYNSYVNVLNSPMADVPSFQRWLTTLSQEGRIVQTFLANEGVKLAWGVKEAWYPELNRSFGTLILNYHFLSEEGQQEILHLIKERSLKEVLAGPVTFLNPPSQLEDPDYV